MVINKNKITSSYAHLLEVKKYIEYLELHDKSSHTIASYLTSIDRLFDFLKIENSDDIKKITYDNGEEFQKYLKDSGLESTSNNTHIRNLKAFFYWLSEEARFYLVKNPFKSLKYLHENEKMQAYMSKEEVSLFLKSCKNITEKAIFYLYLSAGIRREELTNIEFSDVIDDSIKIHGKGRKERIVTMPQETYNIVTKYIVYRNNKYPDVQNFLFVSNKGGKFSGEGIRSKFKAIMKRAGFSQERIDALHVHSTRHTFTTNFIEENDMKMAQEVLGHSNIAITSRVYAHIGNDRLAKAMRSQKSLLQ